MKVTELIQLINELSTDQPYLTDIEKQSYLRMLNMANLDLYHICATGLRSVVKKKKIFLDPVSNTFPLPSGFFLTRAVYRGKDLLLSVDVNKALEIPLGSYLVLDNSVEISSNTMDHCFYDIDPIDGVNKKYLTIFYAVDPKVLVENVANADLETDEPIIPKPYHHFLAHGALYYFYFFNRVFPEKLAFINSIWEQDKAELAKFKNYAI